MSEAAGRALMISCVGYADATLNVSRILQEAVRKVDIPGLRVTVTHAMSPDSAKADGEVLAGMTEDAVAPRQIALNGYVVDRWDSPAVSAETRAMVVDEVAAWLSRLVIARAQAGLQLSARVEELVGVIAHLVVYNDELRAWAEALAAEVQDLNEAVDEWQVYARDLKLYIAELEAKNRDLWAQLAQAGGLKRRRLRNTIDGIALAITLLQGPAAVEDVGQRFGLIGREPSQPSVTVIVNEISARCDMIIQHLDIELPESS